MFNETLDIGQFVSFEEGNKIWVVNLNSIEEPFSERTFLYEVVFFSWGELQGFGKCLYI